MRATRPTRMLDLLLVPATLALAACSPESLTSPDPWPLATAELRCGPTTALVSTDALAHSHTPPPLAAHAPHSVRGEEETAGATATTPIPAPTACLPGSPGVVKPVPAPASAALPATAQLNRTLADMRRATARYHDLDAALVDGFVFLHGCEVRPDEGPAGMLYVHFDRLLDGRIDPATPEALLYEPAANGKPKLVGVELAIPYAHWPELAPPTFFGATFQPEDEFGVWGLHVWLWRHNPEGMFAESHPGISCGD